MITLLKDENHKPNLSTILKAVDTVHIFARTLFSVTLTVTGSSLIVKPNSTGIACGVSSSIKIFLRSVKMKLTSKEDLMRDHNQLITRLTKLIGSVYKRMRLKENVTTYMYSFREIN